MSVVCVGVGCVGVSVGCMITKYVSVKECSIY